MTQHGKPWPTMVHHGPLTHHGHHCHLFFNISLSLSASAVRQLNTPIICFLQEMAQAINLNEMFPTGVPLSPVNQNSPDPGQCSPFQKTVSFRINSISFWELFWWFSEKYWTIFFTLILYGESLTIYWKSMQHKKISEIICWTQPAWQYLNTYFISLKVGGRPS